MSECNRSKQNLQAQIVAVRMCAEWAKESPEEKNREGLHTSKQPRPVAKNLISSFSDVGGSSGDSDTQIDSPPHLVRLTNKHSNISTRLGGKHNNGEDSSPEEPSRLLLDGGGAD